MAQSPLKNCPLRQCALCTAEYYGSPVSCCSLRHRMFTTHAMTRRDRPEAEVTWAGHPRQSRDMTAIEITIDNLSAQDEKARRSLRPLLYRIPKQNTIAIDDRHY